MCPSCAESRDDFKWAIDAVLAECGRSDDEIDTAVAAERARCAAVCRGVVARYRSGACGCIECDARGDGARECAEAIERAQVATLDAHRTRADAAEADRDYWREQATGMAPSVDGMRALCTRLFPGGTGCVVDPERVVAAVDALRAIIAGRTVAPSDEEIAAHAAAGGSWLVRDCRDETTTTRVGWHPLDATGRPCAWPTGGGL
jgi:hypothetical protein